MNNCIITRLGNFIIFREKNDKKTENQIKYEEWEMKSVELKYNVKNGLQRCAKWADILDVTIDVYFSAVKYYK